MAVITIYEYGNSDKIGRKYAGARDNLSAERPESVSPGLESCSSEPEVYGAATFVIVLTKDQTDCHALTADFHL
jgi:hypothetical protein